MEIVVNRKWKKPNYTIGTLTIDGKYFCETLEDTDRGLKDTMSEAEITKIKKPNTTAIPTGTYTIDLNTFSPRFGNRDFYKSICNGKVPRVQNVKGFSGVLIHCGNDEQDTSGCILVGENKVKGKVINSKETFKKLYTILKGNSGKIILKIV